MTRRRLLLIAACLVVTPSIAWAAGRINPAKMTVTPSGLRYQDVKVGRGVTPQPGQTVQVLYTGWLWTNGKIGRKFDSSLSRRHPFEFPLGEEAVIAGWDEGLSSMKVGGTRLLLIPPNLAYGDQGAAGVIPPGATLLFEVHLVGVK